ncbi:MAG TPA: GTP-binding protein 8 [Vicinamibacterales bacterium]|nr:GTP-binding protein 8 [Vicinamibacterales bacterium]
MKLLSARFVASAAAGDRILGDGARLIALAGRSNVGKSSLINALCRTRLARTSAAPGKTRLANIYRVSLEGGPGGPGRWSVHLVDLPGYGYARGGADAAGDFASVAESYLTGGARGRRPAAARASRMPPSRGPLAVLMLVDARHPGLESDLAAAAWLGGLGVERLVVATKIDKLTRADRARNLRRLEAAFGTAALPVSAASGEGLDLLWQTIARIARNGER